jgi:hypothetical protein
MAGRLLNRIERAIDDGDGPAIARFFDIAYLTKNRSACDELSKTDFDSDAWCQLMADVVQVPLQPTVSESFQIYDKVVTAIIRQFDELRPALSIPCIRPIAHTLHYFATHADYTESVNQLQKLLPKAVKAGKHGREGSPLLAVVNALMAVYFLRNNFKQAANVLKTITADDTSFLSLEVTTFRFNEGRTHAVKGEFAKAYESLSFAWTHCPLDEVQNRRLILVYLIPVQLCRGYLPDRAGNLLRKYQLQVYQDFADAVAEGDIAKYDSALDRNQLLLMRLGLFELLAKAKRVVLFQLVRIVHDAYEDSKVPLLAVHNTLNLFQEYTIEETVAVLNTLFEAKLVRAYCHMGYQLVVCKQQDAFPAIEAETY